jgi:hypothetical protein
VLSSVQSRSSNLSHFSLQCIFSLRLRREELRCLIRKTYYFCSFINRYGITCVTLHHFARHYCSVSINSMVFTLELYIWYIFVVEVCILQQRFLYTSCCLNICYSQKISSSNDVFRGVKRFVTFTTSGIIIIIINEVPSLII